MSIIIVKHLTAAGGLACSRATFSIFLFASVLLSTEFVTCTHSPIEKAESERGGSWWCNLGSKVRLVTDGRAS